MELALIKERQSLYSTLPYNQKLGLHIRLHRERLGLSQKQLADRVFATRWTVGRWESGRLAVTCEELESIAVALETSSDRLLP